MHFNGIVSNRMSFSSDIDIEYDWHITNACNFNCEYCFPSIQLMKNKNTNSVPPYDLAIKAFNRSGLKANINMNGGEPFLFPDFLKLCLGLTKKHHIGINTNLSVPDVISFANNINPLRVSYIWAAIHFKERVRRLGGFDSYLKYYNLLLEKGFNIWGLYLIHPETLGNYQKEVEYLKVLGINRLKVKLFRGIYKRKRYPEAFPKSLASELEGNSGGYEYNSLYLSGKRTLRGSNCMAGYRFFKIWDDGTIHRCASDSACFGNFFSGPVRFNDGPQPCRVGRVQTLSQCMRLIVSRSEPKP